MHSSHTLVQITDCHLLDRPGERLHGLDPDHTLAQVLKCAEALEPDLIIASGDLTENGAPDAYRRLQDLLHNAPAPVVCLPGNHDNPEYMKTLLPNGRISLDEGVTLDGWLLCFLNSTVSGRPHGHLGGDRLEALAEQLSAQPNADKLVFVHHQPVPTQSPWIDAMGLDNGAELLALLARDKRVRALAFGHIHHEFEGEFGSIRLFGTPATSFQALPRQPSMVLDKVRGPGLRWFKLYYEDGRFETGVDRALAGAPTNNHRRSPRKRAINRG